MKLITGEILTLDGKRNISRKRLFSAAIDKRPLEGSVQGLLIEPDASYFVAEVKETRNSITFKTFDMKGCLVGELKLESRRGKCFGSLVEPHVWGIITANIVTTDAAVPCRKTSELLMTYQDLFRQIKLLT